MQTVLYHLKPYMLMGGGLICVSANPNAVVFIGGAVLVLLGALIYKMRHAS